MFGSDYAIPVAMTYALAAIVVGVGLAPLVHLWPRTVEPASVAPPAWARFSSVLVGLVGVVLSLAWPAEIALGLLYGISLSGQGDEAASAFDFLAAIAALLIGPALVVSARRIASHSPTSHAVVAALSVLVFALVGASACATAYEPTERLVAVEVGLAIASIGPLVALAVFAGASRAQGDAARVLAAKRFTRSTFLLALLMILGAALVAFVWDELGDRLSNHPYDASWYPPMQTATAVALAACGLSAVIDLTIAVWSSRVRRTSLSARSRARGSRRTDRPQPQSRALRRPP